MSTGRSDHDHARELPSFISGDVSRTRGYQGAVAASSSTALQGGAMSYARQLLDTYPRTVYALSDCAQACVACADADLAEPDVTELITCIRLCWDCADVCTATMGVVSRQTSYTASDTRPLLQACISVCKACGDECELHASHHEHCRVCQESCRRCEQACRTLLDALK